MPNNAAFYMVHIKRSSDSTDDIKKKMNLCLDWYRLNAGLWIVYSIADVEKLYARFRPLIDDSGQILICKMDVSVRQGWMYEKFWEWLRKASKEE